MQYLVFVFLFFVPMISNAQVYINEIMYDLPASSGADAGREWVEIYNSGSGAIDLTGWKFFENDVNHSLSNISGGVNLPAGGYAIIADNSTSFLVDWPLFSGILFDSSFSLNNTGETLVLKDSTQTVVDEVTYQSATGADGDGNSLARSGSTWTALAPTPGAINDAIAPVITLNGDNPHNVWSANTYMEPGATAMDNIDGNISSGVIINSSVIQNGEAGSYLVTYNATDSAGNNAEPVTRTVTVRAASSGGGGSSSSGGGNNTVSVAPVGQVLGAFTEAERQAQITTIKIQLASLIRELIGLLRAQLAAAITAGNQ